MYASCRVQYVSAERFPPLIHNSPSISHSYIIKYGGMISHTSIFSHKSRSGLQSAKSLGKHYGVIKRILLGLCKCQCGNSAGLSCLKVILE